MTVMTTGQASPHRMCCDSCFSTERVMIHLEFAGNSRNLCPQCAARDAMQEAIEQHLHSLLWPVIVRWAQHWHAAGAEPGQMQGALWLYGAYWHPEGQLARPGGEKQAVEDALRENVQPVPVTRGEEAGA